jgi:hypothetical protein
VQGVLVSTLHPWTASYWVGADGHRHAIFTGECGWEYGLAPTSVAEGFDAPSLAGPLHVVTPLPEPAAVPAMIAGIVVLGLLRQWRRRH